MMQEKMLCKPKNIEQIENSLFKKFTINVKIILLCLSAFFYIVSL